MQFLIVNCQDGAMEIFVRKYYLYPKKKHGGFSQNTRKTKKRLSFAGAQPFTMPYIPKTAYLRCFWTKNKNGNFLSKLPFLYGRGTRTRKKYSVSHPIPKRVKTYVLVLLEVSNNTAK